MIKILTKAKVNDFLAQLAEGYQLAGPVASKRGRKKDKQRIEFDFIEDTSCISLERLPDQSAKKFFLPQDEFLGHERELEMAEPPEKPIVLIGLRACDLAALDVLDDVYLEESYIDLYYKTRREHTILVGYGCLERQNQCFCDSLGIDPLENKTAHLYMYKDGDRFFIKVMDEKYAGVVAKLPEGDPEELEQLLQRTRKQFASAVHAFELPTPLPEPSYFEAPIWDKATEKCLSCGVCTYYCPTCYCFGFFWDKDGAKTEKWRSWDSCMFPAFTKHASGHNPREEKSQRYRQRIMHKFSYHPQNFDRLGCVGCGRCTANCPVSLDIKEVLKLVEEYPVEGEVKDRG